MKPVFKRVAVIGLGLMGGSLGLALRRGGMAGTVAGFARRAETRALAVELEIVDEVFDSPAGALRAADIGVFCTSVGSIPSLLEGCLAELGPNTALTDVGSCKAQIIKRVEKFFPKGPVPFVGSHPIAGAERQGIESASADLYRGAVVVMTPTRRTAPEAHRKIAELWSGLGSVPHVLSAAEHDRILARTSHLPHLAAAALAVCVGRERTDKIGLFCGSGFGDATRIAEGDARLWRDIIEANLTAVLHEWRIFNREAKRLKDMLEAGDLDMLEQYLQSGGARRRELIQAKKGCAQ